MEALSKCFDCSLYAVAEELNSLTLLIISILTIQACILCIKVHNKIPCVYPQISDKLDLRMLKSNTFSKLEN